MISPRMIITGVSEQSEGRESMQFRLSEVWEECKKMGFEVLFPPQPFSFDDLKEWVSDTASPEDFLLNIQEGESSRFSYKSDIQNEVSQRLVSVLSQWTQTEFSDAQIFIPENTVESFFAELQPNAWNIVFPSHITKKEMLFSILGIITDLYTNKHSLLSDSQMWPFRDVPSSHFAFTSIKKAKEKGVITGYKGDVFQPNGGMTRGEFLYVLERLGLL